MAARRFNRNELQQPAHTHTALTAPIDFNLQHAPQAAWSHASPVRANNEPANILELPKTSTDFVGYWGGYVHSSIQRLSPDLVGVGPDRVSVVFGRHDDNVFLASQLYSSPKQHIVHQPKTIISNPRLATIKYESADSKLYYVCSHRFVMVNAFTISYRATIQVFDLKSRRALGVVTQIARLKRLSTIREQLRFSRPASNQTARTQITAEENLHDINPVRTYRASVHRLRPTTPTP